jgi:hypothetical protein
MLCVCVCVCVRPPLQMLNTLNGFEETGLELHTTEQVLRTIVINFLQLGIPTQWTGEMARREQLHRA